MFRVLASSRVRGTSFDIKIRNKFIGIKYSAPNWFIIFIKNDWYKVLSEFSSNQLKTLHRCYKHIVNMYVTFSRRENNF